MASIRRCFKQSSVKVDSIGIMTTVEWKIADCLWFVKVSLKDIIIYHKPPTQRNWLNCRNTPQTPIAANSKNLNPSIVFYRWVKLASIRSYLSIQDNNIAAWGNICSNPFVICCALKHYSFTKIHSEICSRIQIEDEDEDVKHGIQRHQFFLWIYKCVECMLQDTEHRTQNTEHRTHDIKQ